MGKNLKDMSNEEVFIAVNKTYGNHSDPNDQGVKAIRREAAKRAKTIRTARGKRR